jgi:hypothetical protein
MVVLVPRQLRMTGMTGNVPYYGGRMSPAQAYAASHPHPPPQPPPQPPPPPRRDRIEALDHLLEAGVVTQEEYADLRARVRLVTGPVQVLVVGFEQPSFSGEVIAELGRLREAGVVRLVDVLLVHRLENGSFDTLPPPAGADPDLGKLAAELLGGEGVEIDGNGWSLADAVPPGGVAAVALLEHLWAEPLVGAIRGAGGTPLAELWLDPEELTGLQL